MAGPFTQDFVESVRNAGDIVRLVSDYVPLKQAGSRQKGLCPFHEEKTPSFSVDPNAQLFYCFGCQTGGDIFKFVMLYEKLGFTDAVEMLAKRWGIPLPVPAGGSKSEDPLERLRGMNRTAENFFVSLLKDEEEGREAREYLNRRGLDADTSASLHVGLAPAGWEGLRNHLVAKRYKSEEILRGGLTLPRKSGSGEYDRFRARLMFPIRDINGRTVAFGGRTLGPEEPKYINSPETPVYTKGRHLYGLDIARETIRREGLAVIVEGYLDLAALVQAGFRHVVASLGTAFTAAQAKLLARYTTRVVFSYDGDSAGSAATVRSLDLLLAHGFDVRVVELPAGEDPDDYIQANGAEAYGQLLAKAPTYLQFLIDREANSRDLDNISEQVAGVNAVLPHLSRLASAVERGSWAGRLADALRIDEALVIQELKAAVKSSGSNIRQRADRTDVPAIHEAEARLVSQLLTSAEQQQRWADEFDIADVEGTRICPIVEKILELARDGRSVDYPTLMSHLTEEADTELLTRIAFREEPDKGPNVEDCLCTLRREKLTREGKQMIRKIGKVADGSPSQPDVDQQLMQLQQLARQRDALS